MINKTNKKAFTLLEFIIVISIITILSSMSVPQFGGRRSRGWSNYNHYSKCISNLRTLQGAIEMYNMDNDNMIQICLPGEEYGELEELLINRGYLKEPLNLPDHKCSYGVYCDKSDGYGTAFCKLHGYVESKFEAPKRPEYDEELEKPFSQHYFDFVNDFNKQKEREYIRKNLISYIFKNYIFTIPFAFTVIIILSIIQIIIWIKKIK